MKEENKKYLKNLANINGGEKYESPSDAPSGAREQENNVEGLTTEQIEEAKRANAIDINNNVIYKITDNAKKTIESRIILQGYLGEMSIWAALQKACDIDLIHIYIDRNDVLLIDKIDSL